MTIKCNHNKIRQSLEFIVFIIDIFGNPALPRLLTVTPAVYLHLNDFTGKLNFPYKNRPTQIRILKPS